MPTSTNQGYTIQSVSRAAAILKCFRENQELGLSEISRMVGLHKSTCSGLINTLKAEGFLEQNQSTSKLRLGFELYSLAVQSKRDLNEICTPHLDKIMNVTNETVNLAVIDKTEIVYIAKKECTQSIRISTSVGARLPIYCTAIGKAALAFMSNDKALSIIDQIKMEQFTEKTITDKNALMKELEKIKADGVAFDYEEFQSGLICIASPIIDRFGVPIGGISVSGPLMRMNSERSSEFAKLISSTAKQINSELQYID